MPVGWAGGRGGPASDGRVLAQPDRRLGRRGRPGSLQDARGPRRSSFATAASWSARRATRPSSTRASCSHSTTTRPSSTGRFAHDPLIGPTVRQLRGMRTRRKATVTHAVVRAISGQLIQAEQGARDRARDHPRVRRGSADPRSARPALVLRGSRPAGSPPSRAATLSRLVRTIDLEGLRGRDDALARLGRERGVGPWTVGRRLAAGARPLRRRARRRPRAREAPGLRAPALARAG